MKFLGHIFSFSFIFILVKKPYLRNVFLSEKVFTFNGQRVEGCHIDAIYQYKYAQLWHNILINCLRVAPCIRSVKIPPTCNNHNNEIGIKHTRSHMQLPQAQHKIAIKRKLQHTHTHMLHVACGTHTHTYTTELTIK